MIYNTPLMNHQAALKKHKLIKFDPSYILETIS